jgi:hypothetical protein
VSALLLAHQGGWDEVLFVLVPVSVFAGLLALANKRAIRDQAERDERDEHDEHDEHDERDGPDPGEPG